MLEFILNNEHINTAENPAMTLLDFIRYREHLKGTKIGCREGDCGACTVLIGSLSEDHVKYRSYTSCLTPLGNVHGKHVVTVEGLNGPKLRPYQQAIVDESGSQCGFCTVGFVMSLAGECLTINQSRENNMISAIDGNICRCTGYKSLERAAANLTRQLQEKDLNDPLSWLVQHDFIPQYFQDIPQRLSKIPSAKANGSNMIVAGGTDLYVQKHDELLETELRFVSNKVEFRGIREENDQITIGAGTNTTDIMESKILQKHFPNLDKHLKLVSSTPIRNMASLAGNLVNASPIGDLSIFFLALDAKLKLKSSKGFRTIDLKDFFLDYKKLDKKQDEILVELSFDSPNSSTFFNFEKVSKRRYLDIASVNSAMRITVENDQIHSAHVSAGGVAPIPKYLKQTSEFLSGRLLKPETIKQATELMKKDISPISDVRGSKAYKTLLLRQLFYAHFIELFPSIFNLRQLL